MLRTQPATQSVPSFPAKITVVNNGGYADQTTFRVSTAVILAHFSPTGLERAFLKRSLHSRF